MKTKPSFTVTSAVLLLLSACGVATVTGSGKIENETRDVHGYNQIVFSAPGELTLEQNGQKGLFIEADDNLLHYIKTSVKGDVLYIYVEPDMIQLYPSKPIRYSLDAGTLTSVTLNGSGDIRADELIASSLDFDLNGSGRILIGAVKSQTTKLDLDGSGEYRFDSLMTSQLTTSLDGSGNIFMQEALVKIIAVGIDGSGTLNVKYVAVDTLNVTINGSGDSTLAGEVNHQTIAIHGSGNYQARNLQSQETDVKIIGSGNSNVWATDELSITIAGSGDITYRGQPAVTETITGSGDLIKLARQ
jgi:hypothetical protein